VGTGEIKYPGLPRGNQALRRSGKCKWEAAVAKLTIGGDEVICTAIDQKPTGEDGSHCIGFRTALWKESRNHHIMISKQQPKYYDESIWYYIFRRLNIPQSDLRAGIASDRIINVSIKC
jgi:hypothetical protein